MGWIDDAKRLSLIDIVQRVGLRTHGRTMTCPCGCERRGRHDRRLAAQMSDGRRWKCWACGAYGDGIDVVAYALTGDRYNGQPEVREWFVNQGEIQIRTKEEEAPTSVWPPQDLIWTIWRYGAKPVIEEGTRLGPDAADDVGRWLAYRLGTGPAKLPWVLEVVKVLRIPPKREGDAHHVAAWLDRKGNTAILPTFDAGGIMRSFRARHVYEYEHEELVVKSRTPYLPKACRPPGQEYLSYACGGLVLANKTAVEMLRGISIPRRVVIAEGEMDFLAWTASEPGGAVLGIGSGWWTKGHADKIPKGARVLIATDQDAAGDRYAQEVADTIGDRAFLTRWRP